LDGDALHIEPPPANKELPEFFASLPQNTQCDPVATATCFFDGDALHIELPPASKELPEFFASFPQYLHAKAITKPPKNLYWYHIPDDLSYNAIPIIFLKTTRLNGIC
jgi:hypothetical protein